MCKKKWIMVIVIVLISIFICKFIDICQYKRSYQDIQLTLISCQDFDMSKSSTPVWLDITTLEQMKEVEKKYDIKLPDIDFEKDMIVLSFGSKLESLKFNFKEPSYKDRRKYIGFQYFEQDIPSNSVYIYIANKVPLMDTDEAGFSPDYRGKYQ